MGRLRTLFSVTLLCVVAGVVGGLGLGYVLSRRGEWLVLQPWILYAAALLIVTGGLTWFDLRRRPEAAPVGLAPHAPSESVRLDTQPAPANAAGNDTDDSNGSSETVGGVVE